MRLIFGNLAGRPCAASMEYSAGQYLQLGDEDYYGKIIRTGMFFTTVEDPDNGHSRIPNNILFQKRFRVTDHEPAPNRYE
jgi:small-conductance mechanosensitive channel